MYQCTDVARISVAMDDKLSYPAVLFLSDGARETFSCHQARRFPVKRVTAAIDRIPRESHGAVTLSVADEAVDEAPRDLTHPDFRAREGRAGRSPVRIPELLAKVGSDRPA